MKVIDPGHIYELYQTKSGKPYQMRFVKRSGGMVTYEKEWSGIQTQAVMRALIDYWEEGMRLGISKTYYLFQLGTIEPFILTLESEEQVCEILYVLMDRSQYLNNILECSETRSAIDCLNLALLNITNPKLMFGTPAESIRMALWYYEARAYRRKQEEVNRLEPAHDDSVSPKAWRYLPCDDVPFNEILIEKRPIGEDGHILVGN